MPLLSKGADDVGVVLRGETVGRDRRLDLVFVEDVHDTPDAGLPAVIAVRQREAVKLSPRRDEVDLTLLLERLEGHTDSEGDGLPVRPVPLPRKSLAIGH